ncbi:MAG: aspartate--tRNA(Asn) ligase [Candidatus Aenigmarchaeota archaeon]|nr:aspartate--tRNA(Asn) ligase [Candidatus Aenigmarchaeota archaeon]
MKRIFTKDVPNKEGTKVMLAGWIRKIRGSDNLRFIILRDMTGELQIILKKGSVKEELLESTKDLTEESVISVEGTVKINEQAPGGLEIIPDKLVVLSKASVPLPIDFSGKVDTGLDKRLDWRCIDLRNPKRAAIIKIQSKFVEGVQEFLSKNDFIFLFTPCIMSGASEGGSEVFPIKYFDKKAFLRQDPQLHRQLAIAAGFDKIVDIGPSWRAELSHTTRHLCEHRGIAVEIGFLKDETDTMRLEEDVIIAGLNRIKKDCKNELEKIGKKIRIPDTPFPEIRFPEIYDILEKLGKKIEFGKDYDTEGEKLLGDYVKKKFGSDFFFVNRFPFAEKPFYVMKVDEEPQWARSVDLIFKGVEQSSGGQREHRYEKIVRQIKEKGLDMNTFKWFVEFFKYGVPPHGGFNLGIERFIMQLLDLDNIREVVLFPRDPERLVP